MKKEMRESVTSDVRLKRERQFIDHREKGSFRAWNAYRTKKGRA